MQQKKRVFTQNPNKMAENQAPKTEKSKRDQFAERLRTKYPDREFADDEALFGQANDDYDESDNQLNQYKEREGKLTQMFSQDPRSAQFITDMAKGNDPWISLIERIGIDGITDLINDPEKQSEYAAANKKYVERLAKEKELQEEYEKNIAESMNLLERIQQERRLGDETLDAAMELVERMAHDWCVGKITSETVDMALNAVNHDADVANARTEGTVAGRNSKIEERLRRPQSGDGMPNLGGSNEGNGNSKKKPNFFDYAEAAS